MRYATEVSYFCGGYFALAAAFFALAGGLTVPAAAETVDWPQFRGADFGHSPAENVPTQITPEKVLWKTPLKGPGASSPILLGDTLYLTCYTGYGIDKEAPGEQTGLVRRLQAFSLADGKLLWSTEFPAETPETEYHGFQALHGYASSTLATDGERLYYFFGKSGVGAVTLEGKPVWNTSVGELTHGWGSAASPIVYKDLLIVNASIESNHLVALDKTTGKIQWKTAGMDESWSTPTIYHNRSGDAEVVLSVKSLVRGISPQTGEELWKVNGIQDYVCPSVIHHAGTMYATGGRRNTLIAIQPDRDADIPAKTQLWEIFKGANVPSPVYDNGHVYWVNESRGAAYCAKAETGEVVYEERLQPRSGTIYASPLLAEGRLYVVSRGEGVFLLAAKPEFELLGHFEPLDESIFNASPLAVDGKLILRSDQFLYCVGN